MLAVLLLAALAAHATDTWTNVAPGVDWLHRSLGGSTPQDIQAARIDLTRETVGLRASMDASGSERHVPNSTFARSVGALVAINGDWSDGTTPVGLAIGNGWQWHDHFDNPAIGGSWGSFACDVFNRCAIESLPRLSEAWWFATPTIAPYRYYNAVGANGLLLWEDGVRKSGCYDGCDGDTCRNPRSAVCLDVGGSTLWLIVVDGRRSGASGMTCGEMRDLTEDLGCWTAAMLDGGGSSTLWVDGAVRNTPSDGGERTVANHLGVLVADAVDPSCRYAGGAWCEGSRLRTCNGGQLVNDGDCGAYGLACQEDGAWAFCVDARCPDGDGTAAACLDATRVAGCTDGVYGEGDCAAFGLVCGEDAAGGGCMDPRCEAGPHSAFCLDGTTVAACTDGAYAEAPCEHGQTCVEQGATATCHGPEDSDPPDSDAPADSWVGPPGEHRRWEDEPQGCGCATRGGGALWALLALAAIPWRRRR
ncbi:MAG: phosphodiester glycosidase family protein [Pseudomonadota bacterium]